MKIFKIFFSIVLIITMSGCLTFRIIHYSIEFSDDFNIGKVTVAYTDIRSSEEDADKRSKEFKELIKLYKDEAFLLDQVEDGIYVKERQLFEKDGSLNAHFSGIFEKLKINENELKVKNNERFILLEISPEEKIETDGKSHRSDQNVLLVWPKDQKKIYFKIIQTVYDETTYPLIDEYRNWKRSN